ncbi:MAG: M48 family metalloprotease [Armatimonadetes bacterium]|nr:M48 family metalloprotease [Armatimonadota bacterium]
MRCQRAATAHRSTRLRGCKGTLSALLLALLLPLGIAAPADAAVISQDQEIRLGRQAAAELEASVGLSRDPALAARVAAIGHRVATVSGRPKLPYTFKVLRGREVNAVSLPGGFIYATEGLMRFADSDDELAFVMAHEVGHVAARHHVTMIERHFFLSIVIALLFGQDPTAFQIADLVRFFVTRGFSREFEFASDRLAVTYAHRAGFDAAAALKLMQRLRAAEGRDPSQFEVLFRTHPGMADRIELMREHLRRLGYRVGRLPDAPARHALVADRVAAVARCALGSQRPPVAA